MRSMKFRQNAWLLGLISFILVLVFLSVFWLGPERTPRAHQINGVNFVGPAQPIGPEALESLEQINSNWIAVIPYAFCWANRPDIYFNVPNQWWGENPEGVIKTIEYAKGKGLKVMLKPQMWVAGDGWPGDFQMQSQQQWEFWEQDYREYIMTYVDIADSMGVEMICIGTEFRQAVKQRPQFWEYLIDEVRARYSGKLTYAANWDNVESVSFWAKLDYVGIDAYYPLSDGNTPSVKELVQAWQPHLDQIEALNQQVNRPVIFTEYGYRSINQTAYKHWEIDKEQEQLNLEAQRNSYAALYQAVSERDWFEGGFLWKWFSNHKEAGGHGGTGFTPQNKPAMDVVKKQFGLNQ